MKRLKTKKSEGGIKSSKTIRDKSTILYVFENIDKQQVVYDSISEFARLKELNVTNLVNTYTNKHRKGCGEGKWKVIDKIHLTIPDMMIRYVQYNNALIPDRIKKKVEEYNTGKGIRSIQSAQQEYIEMKKQELATERPAVYKKVISNDDMLGYDAPFEVAY